MADDIVSVRHFGFTRREGEKPHHVVKVDSAFHKVEVTFSPTGRAVHIWLDGLEMEARRG